jgi:RimJ/RimL family protein N-acetyltransferase
MSHAEPGFSIGPAAAEQSAEALALVFCQLPPEFSQGQVEALLADAQRDPQSLDGLLIARRGQRLVGAIFSQIQPGYAALLWPPRIVPAEPAETLGRLLAASDERLVRRQVRIVQCLVPDDSHADDALLTQDNYRHLATLLYLASMEKEYPTSAPQGSLVFEPSNASNDERLRRVVETTYQQTLDCPALNGIRTVEEVLTGYRSAGEFDPRLWFLVTHDGEDVGCLLLSDYPEQENWELIYMGLVPSARGHGWGKQIARQAQWLARQAGRPRLVLAVDAANVPALRMYAAAGFRAWQRRRVFLKTFSSRVTSAHDTR